MFECVMICFWIIILFRLYNFILVCRIVVTTVTARRVLPNPTDCNACWYTVNMQRDDSVFTVFC